MRTIFGYLLMIPIFLLTPFGGIFLTAVSIVYIWYAGDTPPGVLAIPCGLYGAFAIYARISAWRMGVAQRGLDILRSDPRAYRYSQNIEALYWSTGFFNLIIFIIFIVRAI